MKTPLKFTLVAALVATVATAIALKPTRSRTAAEASPPAAAATAKLPRLLDLGAGKCVPCKMMKPILDDLKTNYAGVFMTDFIDVWENPDAGKQHRVEMIPTQIFYDADGKELFRHTGFLSKEDILGKWRELGVDVKP